MPDALARSRATGRGDELSADPARNPKPAPDTATAALRPATEKHLTSQCLDLISH
jgi:hypothetical protein